MLNIALTSKEIDLLLNFCDFSIEKLINWKEFVKRFSHAGDKKKIIERVYSKMQRFSDLLHYYMIAPKDAYRKVLHKLIAVQQPLNRVHELRGVPEYGQRPL